MLIVPTYLAPSTIHGVGVFATRFIPKGTVLWVFEPKVDQIITADTLASLAPVIREYVEEYGYISKDFGGIFLCGDNTRFVNHNPAPNTGGGDTYHSTALRDIHPGEEITCDYRDLCSDYAELPYVKASVLERA